MKQEIDVQPSVMPVAPSAVEMASVIDPKRIALLQQVVKQPSYTRLPVKPAQDVGGGTRGGSLRLASFTTPLSVERQRPQDLTAPIIQYPSTEIPVQSKGTLARVQAIISKYAPRHDSPRTLAEAIVKESSQQGYDPLFVAAVIKSESTFNAKAKSNKGAQGLMQIMPATGAWLTERNELPRGKLNDPGHNLKVGISYLKHLESEYKGDKMFTLVAYNWGPGRVESAAGGKRRVPKECLSYALRILSDYRRWKSGVI